MKLIFAGTPEFAAVALTALLEAGHEISLVLTQPDRPAGRGMRARESSVKVLAKAHALPIAQPPSLKSVEAEELLRAQAADAMVVAAYGLILPVAALEIPRLGCLNIHASLLPRWRGAAPIQRALLAGDRETGITVMQMNAGLDTGNILLQEATPIQPDDTTKTLHDRLAEIGGRCIVRVFTVSLTPVPQDDTRATYAAKITKAEAEIDWSFNAAEICLRVRAYNPVPGAITLLEGVVVKVWSAQAIVQAAAVPGSVLQADNEGIVVASGDGAVRILELQKAGGKRLTAAAFLSGSNLRPGARFGT